MIYWERQTTCDNRPFFVLEVQFETGDTLEEFREFVETWIYKTTPRKRYLRVDWHNGDRQGMNSVVADGDRQIDCFFSGLDVSEFIVKVK